MAEDPLNRVRSVGVFAVLRAPSAAAALDATAALLRGGISGIEVTYSTPDAAAVIAEATRRYGDVAYVGAGTVTTPAQAREAAEAGAAFLVSPGTLAGLVAAMKATGAVTMTGALTPTEVMQATEAGADIVKIFPAFSVGPSFIRALRGPFPQVPLLPTGGVTSQDLGEWLVAGAVAVGAGGELVPASALAHGDVDEIVRRARLFRDALDRARGSTESIDGHLTT